MHNDDDSRISLVLADEIATTSLAKQLAKLVRPGMIMYLNGDLGSGKTALVRGILSALGYKGRIKSPTYTLVETYHIAGLDLYHFDLYRLRYPAEWDSAGFQEEFNGHNTHFVEWPDKAMGYIPGADIEISLEILVNGRKATIHANSNMGRQCIAKLH